MRSFRPSLTVSIMAFLGCLLVATWLMFSLLAFKTAERDLYAQKGEHARTMLAAFVSQLPAELPVVPASILTFDSSAAVYVQKLSADAVFTRLTLLDRNGQVIFTAGRNNSDVFLPFAVASLVEGSRVLPNDSGLAAVLPVKRDGAVVGKAGLVLSLASEKSRLTSSRRLLLLYFVIDFLLLFFLGSYVLSRIVVNPIARLLAATVDITGGHYGQKVRVSGSAELAQLADAFNRMSQALADKEQQVGEHVTALENANAGLRQAREETIRSEKMASIGLLAAGMAHEIGTPLAAIMGYAELLGTEQVEEASVRDYASRISSDCARIDRIVRGLLDYSRPRAAGGQAADVRQVVEQSVELLREQGAFKQVSVAVAVGDGTPMARIDPHQLQQVLINLLLNSRDAMPQGGDLTVRAAANAPALPGSSQGTAIRIDVLDTGTGIPEEHLKNIFDPFFTTKPPGKGTGLGLAISARIIEGFGGRMAVRSVVGKGTCFSILLPVAEPETAEAP